MNILEDKQANRVRRIIMALLIMSVIVSFAFAFLAVSPAVIRKITPTRYSCDIGDSTPINAKSLLAVSEKNEYKTVRPKPTVNLEETEKVIGVIEREIKYRAHQGEQGAFIYPLYESDWGFSSRRLNKEEMKYIINNLQSKGFIVADNSDYGMEMLTVSWYEELKW